MLSRAVPAALLRWLPCLIAGAIVIPRLGKSSLRYDEAWVANSISLAAFTPFALATTPLGFAQLVAWVVRIAEPTEFWFRFVPLLGALGSILLIFVVSEQLLRNRFQAAFAAALLATNHVALVYSTQLKAYTADMFFSLLCILMAERVARSPSISRLVSYALVIAVTPLFSFGAILALGASLAVLLARASRGHLGSNRRWAPCLGLPIIVVGLYYVTFARAQRSSRLDAVWAAAFPPDPQPGLLVSWYAEQTLRIVNFFLAPGIVDQLRSVGSPGGASTLDLLIALVGPVATGGLALAGLVASIRHRPREVCFLIGPLVLAGLLSLFRLYPYSAFGARVLLFGLPGFLILAARGLGACSHAVHAHRARPALLALLAVGVPAANLAYVSSFARPLIPLQELRDPVVRVLRPQLEPGDLVYVSARASHGFQFYAPEFRLEGFKSGQSRTVAGAHADVAYGSWPDPTTDEKAEILALIRERLPRRLWLVAAEPRPEDEAMLFELLGQCGTVDLVERSPGAAVYRMLVWRAPCDVASPTGKV